MKKTALIFMVISFCALINAPHLKADAKPELVWGKHIGTTESDDVIGVAADNAGGIFAVGSTSGVFGETHFGKSDALICKLNSEGEFVWKQQLGTPEDDNGRAVVCDAENNCYIAGITKGDLGSENAGREDAFLAKYDPQGNLLWVRQIGTNGNERGGAVTVDDNGNVYLAGSTTKSLAGTAAGSYDAFVAKYSPEGEQYWVAQYGTTKKEEVYGIAVDKDGNSYVTGDTDFVFKFDSNGSFLWSWNLTSHFFRDIDIDNLGSIYLAGVRSSNSSAVMLKLDDATQKPVWQKYFYSTWCTYKGLTVTKDGTGEVVGAGCQGPGCQAFARRYDKDGNLVWEQDKIGRDGDSCGFDVAMDKNGNYYEVGGTAGDLFIANLGNGDGFIYKLGSTNPSGLNESNPLPKEIKLNQNFPNPFNSSSEITYSIPKNSFVNLSIYNITGQKVRSLINNLQESGEHKAIWDGTDDFGTGMSSGIYFYELALPDQRMIKKMILVQ